MAAAKRPKRKKPQAKLLLTADEAELLRDVLGVLVPVQDGEGGVAEGCVSSMLAEATNRGKVEQKLWSKLCAVCDRLGILVGAEAPTFAVSADEVPTMHVYEIGR